ncbi:hypothetical protein C2W62_02305 [Candidatus Entotheonella serta]|nr:hypothetical protein C2W62_02305 [Candidatus Entotheonella serta]
MFEEIGRIYDALVVSETPKLPEVAFQYTDFVLWERERLAVQDMEPSLNYWRYHLAGGTFRLDLPIAHRRPLEQTYPGRNQPLHFSPELIAGLRALSQRENATLFMTLTAGFKLLLFRYTGQTDITLGTSLANRSRPELQGMLGFLITMLVLHTEISGEITFAELLHRLRRVLLDAYAHQDVPFTKLLEVAQLDRDWSRNPLFQFSFIFLSEEGAAEGLKSLEMIPSRIRFAKLQI